jgi:hypothetical protein
MRTATFAIFGLNVAVIVFVMATACTGVDVTPSSWVRGPACLGLFWLVLGLPASSATVGALLLRRAYRGTPARRIGLPAHLAVLLFWGLFFASSPLWSRGYTYQIRGAQYEQLAGDWTVQEFLPPQSRDIRAWVRPFRTGIAASFRISEEDFVSWAQRNQWGLMEIHGVEVHNVSADCDPNGSVRIENGLLHQWTHDKERPWVLFRVYAYDRSNGLGYFTELVD